MGLNSNVMKISIVVVVCAIVGVKVTVATAHSAFVLVGGNDPEFTIYSGTSNPPGLDQINIVNDSPGFLNEITGGGLIGQPSEGAAGTVSIFDPVASDADVVALAIQVQIAGSSFSLSKIPTAQAAIVSDLNTSIFDTGQLTAYAYQDVPQQYADQINELSAGEAANGGQPFDILLVEDFPFQRPSGFAFWDFYFSDEVGSNGITALQMTDVGALPEPSTVALIALGGMSLVRRRRK